MSIFPEHFSGNALENALTGAFSRSIFPDHFSGGSLLAHGGPEPRLGRSPDSSSGPDPRLGPLALEVLVPAPVPIHFHF